MTWEVGEHASNDEGVGYKSVTRRIPPDTDRGPFWLKTQTADDMEQLDTATMLAVLSALGAAQGYPPAHAT